MGRAEGMSSTGSDKGGTGSSERGGVEGAKEDRALAGL